MSRFSRTSLFLSSLWLSASSALAGAQLQVSHPQPSNLFSPEQSIGFEIELQGFSAGEGELTARVQDYFGRPVCVATQPVRVEAGKNAVLPLTIGTPGVGYYELTLDARVKQADGQSPQAATQMVSFGVAPFVSRSAEQVRSGNYRFGLKKWNYGKGKGGQEWSEDEAVAGCARLGLQWTRELFNQREHLGVLEMVKKHPMNVVLKVERFPVELFDTERYGPMKEWEAKYGRGAWTLKTLPRKEPYQKWLREQISLVPPEQNVFEIWNEAWDKMSPEDFSVLCQWITEVILAARPEAIIGPNLLGDTSPYQFDARVIKAGGMRGMKMVALHPYGGSEDRAWLREYRQWLRAQLGHDVDVYVTEFGSHSTPEGPAKRSEREQAVRIVRQALALYAEGVKAFMPHTMGQAERNPTYVEDWFGLMRFSHQPKPALMAYANAARQIDGSRYVGDLWFGPGCDAMLFERAGVYTLALGTKGESKTLELDLGAAVKVVDMVGAAVRPTLNQGRLSLEVGADWIYLVGVNPDLAKQASLELNPQRWPAPAKPPRSARTIHRFKTPPAVDGKLAEWSAMTQVAMLNPKVSGEDASGMAYLGWDVDYLYVALDMRDNELLNTRPRAKLYQQDSLELFVSTEPRDRNAGYGPRDHQFLITPSSGEGKSIVGEIADREAGKVEDVKNARFVIEKGGQGWIAEVAIPWNALPGFSPQSGAKAALEMRVNDADTSHERFKLDPSDGNPNPSDPTAWSYLLLEE